MKKSILNAFDAVLDREAPAHEWVQSYTPPAEPGIHQFVLFLKPEVTLRRQGALPGVLELTLDALKSFDVEVGAVRILRGDYLAGHRIMDQHYGVLNAISKSGRSAISPSAEIRLTELYADELAQGAEVLGGHQFLEQQPEFSALALSTFSDNLGGSKLGGGTYAFPLTVKGARYILLNAFHAYQLEPYCKPENAIVVMDCRSPRAWADLRQKLAGATDPLKALEGSLRNRLLRNQQSLGLADVSQGSNGIHLSAGPLEGMVELKRFLSDPDSDEILDWRDLNFARILQARGLSAQQIDALAANPLLPTEEGQESAFDLTEEMNTDDAATALAERVRS